jgi:predicted nucleic acid-binding Zn ribbon protein
MVTTLGNAIDKMLKKYGIEKSVRQGQALFLWGEIVGEKIAKHTNPEKVAYGKLYIKVDSPVWRSELMYTKGQILKKLNNQLKGAKIKEIVLR